jgi:hypothetical protein
MGGMNGRVSSKAASVSVLRIDVGGAGDVEGLDVEEREGLRPNKAAEHNVRSVREASARASHPLLEGPRPLGRGIDVFRAEEGVKAHRPRVNRRVVACARQAHAMAARGAEVAVKRTDPARGGVGDVRGALAHMHGADGDVALTADRR